MANPPMISVVPWMSLSSVVSGMLHVASKGERADA